MTLVTKGEKMISGKKLGIYPSSFPVSNDHSISEAV